MALLEKIGGFRDLEHIADGETSDVYLTDCAEHGSVVVRVPRPGARIDRPRAEALAGQELRHPNIVTVHEVSPPGEPEYVVMEYIGEPTLRQMLDAAEGKGSLPPRVVAQVGFGVCRALGEAYRHIEMRAHGRISPDNIFVGVVGDSAHMVKLTGFGIIKAKQEPGLRFTGRPSYAAPEQLKGRAPVTARTDIYALGAVLYECATGSPMFEGEDAQVIDAQLNLQPVPPSTLQPDIPPELEAIILRCLSKNPEDRYDSVWELCESLCRLFASIETRKSEEDDVGLGTTHALPAVVRRTSVRSSLMTGLSLLAAGVLLAAVLIIRSHGTGPEAPKETPKRDTPVSVKPDAVVETQTPPPDVAETAFGRAERLALRTLGPALALCEQAARQAQKAAGVEEPEVGSLQALVLTYEEAQAQLADAARGVPREVLEGETKVTRALADGRASLARAVAFAKGLAATLSVKAEKQLAGATTKARNSDAALAALRASYEACQKATSRDPVQAAAVRAKATTALFAGGKMEAPAQEARRLFGIVQALKPVTDRDPSAKAEEALSLLATVREAAAAVTKQSDEIQLLARLWAERPAVAADAPAEAVIAGESAFLAALRDKGKAYLEPGTAIQSQVTRVEGMVNRLEAARLAAGEQRVLKVLEPVIARCEEADRRAQALAGEAEPDARSLQAFVLAWQQADTELTQSAQVVPREMQTEDSKVKQALDGGRASLTRAATTAKGLAETLSTKAEKQLAAARTQVEGADAARVALGRSYTACQTATSQDVVKTAAAKAKETDALFGAGKLEAPANDAVRLFGLVQALKPIAGTDTTVKVAQAEARLAGVLAAAAAAKKQSDEIQLLARLWAGRPAVPVDAAVEAVIASESAFLKALRDEGKAYLAPGMAIQSQVTRVEESIRRLEAARLAAAEQRVLKTLEPVIARCEAAGRAAQVLTGEAEPDARAVEAFVLACQQADTDLTKSAQGVPKEMLAGDSKVRRALDGGRASLARAAALAKRLAQKFAARGDEQLTAATAYVKAATAARDALAKSYAACQTATNEDVVKAAAVKAKETDTLFADGKFEAPASDAVRLFGLVQALKPVAGTDTATKAEQAKARLASVREAAAAAKKQSAEIQLLAGLWAQRPAVAADAPAEAAIASENAFLAALKDKGKAYLEPGTAIQSQVTRVEGTINRLEAARLAAGEQRVLKTLEPAIARCGDASRKAQALAGEAEPDARSLQAFVLAYQQAATDLTQSAQDVPKEMLAGDSKVKRTLDGGRANLARAQTVAKDLAQKLSVKAERQLTAAGTQAEKAAAARDALSKSYAACQTATNQDAVKAAAAKAKETDAFLAGGKLEAPASEAVRLFGLLQALKPITGTDAAAKATKAQAHLASVQGTAAEAKKQSDEIQLLASLWAQRPAVAADAPAEAIIASENAFLNALKDKGKPYLEPGTAIQSQVTRVEGTINRLEAARLAAGEQRVLKTLEPAIARCEAAGRRAQTLAGEDEPEARSLQALVLAYQQADTELTKSAQGVPREMLEGDSKVKRTLDGGRATLARAATVVKSLAQKLGTKAEEQLSTANTQAKKAASARDALSESYAACQKATSQDTVKAAAAKAKETDALFAGGKLEAPASDTVRLFGLVQALKPIAGTDTTAKAEQAKAHLATVRGAAAEAKKQSDEIQLLASLWAQRPAVAADAPAEAVLASETAFLKALKDKGKAYLEPGTAIQSQVTRVEGTINRLEAAQLATGEQRVLKSLEPAIARCEEAGRLAQALAAEPEPDARSLQAFVLAHQQADRDLTKSTRGVPREMLEGDTKVKQTLGGGLTTLTRAATVAKALAGRLSGKAEEQLAAANAQAQKAVAARDALSKSYTACQTATSQDAVKAAAANAKETDALFAGGKLEAPADGAVRLFGLVQALKPIAGTDPAAKEEQAKARVASIRGAAAAAKKQSDEIQLLASLWAQRPAVAADAAAEEVIADESAFLKALKDKGKGYLQPGTAIQSQVERVRAAIDVSVKALLAGGGTAALDVAAARKRLASLAAVARSIGETGDSELQLRFEGKLRSAMEQARKALPVGEAERRLAEEGQSVARLAKAFARADGPTMEAVRDFVQRYQDVQAKLKAASLGAPPDAMAAPSLAAARDSLASAQTAAKGLVQQLAADAGAQLRAARAKAEATAGPVVAFKKQYDLCKGPDRDDAFLEAFSQARGIGKSLEMADERSWTAPAEDAGKLLVLAEALSPVSGVDVTAQAAEVRSYLRDHSGIVEGAAQQAKEVQFLYGLRKRRVRPGQVGRLWRQAFDAERVFLKALLTEGKPFFQPGTLTQLHLEESREILRTLVDRALADLGADWGPRVQTTTAVRGQLRALAKLEVDLLDVGDKVFADSVQGALSGGASRASEEVGRLFIRGTLESRELQGAVAAGLENAQGAVWRKAREDMTKRLTLCATEFDPKRDIHVSIAGLKDEAVDAIGQVLWQNLQPVRPARKGPLWTRGKQIAVGPFASRDEAAACASLLKRFVDSGQIPEGKLKILPEK